MPRLDSTRHRLNVTQLEARDVPASFGIPWSDPTHLTLSFAPDGANAFGVSSSLAAALNGQMATADWHAAILKAAQTWANAANLNIGVVADNGDPFGSAGATQADPRFGDIRIAGVPMAGDALGEAIPPDPLLSGTSAGDVFFNTTSNYTASALNSVALHEIGHALGLPSSSDPNSIMSDTFTGLVTLGKADLAAIRVLYGQRDFDPTLGVKQTIGNAGFTWAKRIQFPTSYAGEIPLTAFGSLGSPTEVNMLQFRNLSAYSGAITVQAQTSGISLVPLRMSVFDYKHVLLGQVIGTGSEGGTVAFTIANSQPGRTYYLRIDAAPGAAAQIGRYGVAVTFDDQLLPVGISINDVLRGPYDALTANDLAKLFADPGNALYNEDGGAHNSTQNPTILPAHRGPLGLTRFSTTGSMSDGSEADVYRIRAPLVSSKVSVTLLASVRAIGPDGITTKVEVVGQDEEPVPAQILVNRAGRYTIQLTGAKSNGLYFLRVFGAHEDSGDDAGNYGLEAAFRTTAVDFQTFASGSVVNNQPSQFTIYAGRTQLFGFALSATGDHDAAVRMTIVNQAGVTVFDLTANGGDTVSGLSTFLAPGAYTVKLTSVGSGQLSGFSIGGSVQTDPIGPQPGGTLYTPMYPDPNNPNGFLYPNGVATLDPFLWVLALI